MYCWACKDALSAALLADFTLEPWLEHGLCRVCYYELHYGVIPRLGRRRRRRRRR
jgi:hypothetical protein